MEGLPAHDPACVEAVKRQFRRNFVEKGWGPLGAVGHVEVRVMAGDEQDGRPRKQMVEIPLVRIFPENLRSTRRLG